MADAADRQPEHEQQVEPVVQADGAAAELDSTPESASTEPSGDDAVAAVDAPSEAATAAPEPTPPPAEPAAPAATVDVPTVASTLEVPASPQVKTPSADQDGGEWDLLVEKVRTWISSGQLQEQWQAARTPLSLLAGLIALLLVLRVYSAVLGVLDSIPLLSGLLELAGLVAVLQFSLTRLVRSNDRREVIVGLKQRWQSFRGRS